MRGIMWEQRISAVMTALLTGAAGGLLLFWPNRTAELLCLVVGGALLVIGLAYILGCFASRRGGVPMWFLIPGIILAALGLWLMRSPAAVVTLVQYVFAAMLVFHSVLDIQGSFALAKMRWPHWWVELLLGVITLALGALIFASPAGSFQVLIMLVGIALIFDGVSDLWIIVRLGRANKDLKRREKEEQAKQERLAEEQPKEEP